MNGSNQGERFNNMNMQQIPQSGVNVQQQNNQPLYYPESAQNYAADLYAQQQAIYNYNRNRMQEKPKIDRLMRKSGFAFLGICAAALFSMILLNPVANVNQSSAATEALELQLSTELGIGTLLLWSDEEMPAQDYTITHSSRSDSTKLYIWDYAAEDGDYVQVLVDGVPLGDPFMIKNKPVEYTIPSTGEVQVIGVRDGGGGITYAVHYDINGTTYFNGTDVGAGNVYTLIRE
ncbi:MAG: hypothetical protein J1E83_11190 [Lachnospiraceae bacterium]|nr:hypothetical protein [Lachnospiraceae bacterium]